MAGKLDGRTRKPDDLPEFREGGHGGRRQGAAAGA